MNKNSGAKIAASNRYRARTYDDIKAVARKEERELMQDLYHAVDFFFYKADVIKRIRLVKLAAGEKGLSASAYIAQAVREALQRDGATIDRLPPLEDGTTNSRSMND